MCRFLLPCISILFIAGCAQTSRGRLISGKGITFIAPRGSRPEAVSIQWLPKDESTMLVRAYETPEMPADIYLLDVGTGQKTVLVKKNVAQFYAAQWAPDAKHVLILAVNHTAGFEPDGWWIMDPVSLSAVNLFPVTASYAA
jgi:dipeptidyl aminopeptidase/acylaminoacyl peptidase